MWTSPSDVLRIEGFARRLIALSDRRYDIIPDVEGSSAVTDAGPPKIPGAPWPTSWSKLE